MNFPSDNDEMHSALIDVNDLRCPISQESYTDENYPVTLLCGHNLSIKAYQDIPFTKSLQNIDDETIQCRECPSCSAFYPNTYSPQKAIILGNFAQQIQSKKKVCCYNHPEKDAVAVCLEEKAFLCVDCLVEDEHPKDKKLSFEKLNNYLLEKKQDLMKCHEKLSNNTDDHLVTQAIMAKIEPYIQNIVQEELKKEINIKQEIDEIAIRIDNNLNDSPSIESFDLLNEIDQIEEKNQSCDCKKKIEAVTNKIISLLEDITKGE